MPMVINGKFYKWYPCFEQKDIGGNTSNKFVDTLSFSNVFCKAAGADYDGDTASVKMLFSDEANAELLKYIDSKAQFINLEANNCRVPEKEAIQSMYNLTLILPDDVDKITKNVEFE